MNNHFKSAMEILRELWNIIETEREVERKENEMISILYDEGDTHSLIAEAELDMMDWFQSLIEEKMDSISETTKK